MADDVLAGNQYKDALTIALSQQDSILAPLAMQSSYQGKAARMIEELAAVEMQRLNSKRDPIKPTDTKWTARWAAPEYFDLALQLDRIEAAQALQNPQSTFIQAAREAVARKKDDVFKTAIFGTALTGANGTTAVTWATEGANQIVGYDANGASSGTAVRLNLAKVDKALKILKQNRVPLKYERVYMAVDAEQVEALYKEAVFISKEYTAEAFQRNDEGIITRFKGINFVEFEGLPNDGTYTQVPVWTEKAMDFGTWDTEITRVYEDMGTRGLPWSTYLYRAFSAARRDPKRIVEIKCKVTA